MSIIETTNPDQYPSTPYGAVTPIGWDQFTAEFMALYAPGLRAACTRKSMARVLGIMQALGVQSTADLTTGLIARLVSSRPAGQSSYTVRGVLRQAQAACTYAVNTRRLAFSPFQIRPLRSWVRLEAPKRGKRHLTREEMHRLIELLKLDVDTKRGWAQWRARRLLALVALVAYTGLRKSEALYLKVEDIDLQRRVLLVISRAEHRTKTACSAAALPIPRPLVPILEEWLKYRLQTPPGFVREPSVWMWPNLNTPTPWVNGSNGCKPLERLAAAAKRAGIPVCTWQMIRRSTATALEGHGAGSAMIQRILRHSNLDTTQRFYLQQDIPNMLRAVEGFEY